MATQEELTKRYEELGLRWLNYLKFRLKQDGATFRNEIVEWFGKWIIAKPKRVTRYEACDFKMLDDFLDFAWPSIMDPKVPLPVEPAEPQKAAGPARAVPTPRRNNNWWGNAEEAGRVIFEGGRAAGRAIDWQAVQRQIFEQAPPVQQQWIVFDQNGNPINR